MARKGKVGKYKYVTNRSLKNKADEEKGRIKVLVPAESEIAQVDYICPECGFSEHTEEPWQRPFSLKCGKCGATMKIPKLKDEIKKDKKKRAK